ncbi:TerB family tellurite resistance protein [Cerasicoccus fimbriatus]|uniref:tellurite resistance TerB family protein n=1 Tax=Cerasicoccus fimbriatus TaxID=3014554 RepID=UPI0022B49B71|nr:TerB family tellurite resistance protein [Cerasicoccus sp. TK19100]
MDSPDSPEFSLALAKMLISAAWVDGEIQPAERDYLKDFVFSLPHMDESTWSSLQTYFESPVDDAERVFLLQELRRLLTRDTQLHLVTKSVRQVFLADGRVLPEEVKAARQITRILQGTEEDSDAEMSNVIKAHLARLKSNYSASPFGKLAEEKAAGFPESVSVFFANRGLEIEVSDMDRDRICLIGCLLAVVANADGSLDPSEKQVAREYMLRRWKFSADVANYICAIMESDPARDLDLAIIVRRLYEATSEADRSLMLKTLLAISAADGRILKEEIDECYRIARLLKVPAGEIEEAMMHIPRRREVNQPEEN